MKKDELKLVIIGVIITTIGIKLQLSGLTYLGSAFVLLAIVASLYPVLNQRIRFRNAELETVDQMTGSQFEDYVAFLLRKNGFNKVKVTQQIGDQGIDIIAEKNSFKYGFQCKRWKKNVGNKAVQEVYSGVGFYKLDKAVVITNSHFTEPAKTLAKRLNVELWSRNQLQQLIENYRLSTREASK